MISNTLWCLSGLNAIIIFIGKFVKNELQIWRQIFNSVENCTFSEIWGHTALSITPVISHNITLSDIHKCPRQLRQSDWTERNHVGVVLTVCKDMAYQNRSQLFCATREADLNQSVTKICITRLTRVLWKCFVCPQNVNLPISISLYSAKAFGSVVIARDRDQNRSLICGKDHPTHFHSLIHKYERTRWPLTITIHGLEMVGIHRHTKMHPYYRNTLLIIGSGWRVNSWPFAFGDLLILRVCN